MNDERKTKRELVAELSELRQRLEEANRRIAELEVSETSPTGRTRAEERDHALYELSLDGVVTVGLDGRVTECNRAYAEMVGYSREELVGFKYQDIMPSSWRALYKKILKEVMERGYSYEFEKEYVRKNGTVFPVSLRTWRIDDESGHPIGVWLIVRDITERKRVEEELGRYSERLEELVEDKTRTLRESGENFRSLAENAGDGILIGFIEKGILVYANKRAAEITGYDAAELLKTSIENLIHPDEYKRIIGAYRKRLAGEDVPRQHETVIVRKDGETVPVEMTATQTIWHGQPAALAIIRDIAERVRIEAIRARAEEALRESEEMYKTLVDTSPESVTVTDLKGRITYVSQQAIRLHGAESAGELLGKSAFELIAPEDHAKAAANLEKTLAEGVVRDLEYTLLRRDGSRFVGELNAAAIKDALGKPKAFIATVRDVTERVRIQETRARAEEALRESEEQLKEAQALGRIGNWEFDVDNQNIIWSDQVYRLYERDPALGPPTAEEEAAYYTPEQVERLSEYARRAIEEGEEFEYDLQAKLPSGTLVHFSATMRPVKNESGRVIRLFGTVQDITERKQAEEEIRKLNAELEQQVAARTTELARRSTQLRVAAEVARDAATAHSLDDLLNRVVNLVRDRFGFYHAGIFLMDKRGEYVVLKAATGEAGRRMLEAGYKLKVGEVGIVGYVTGGGQLRVALDVGADALHFENPFLPETRSEMALPLKVGDRIIGALDVQSVHEATFGADDVAALQIMADQLAVAIERTRLFEQAEAALEERLRTVVANAPIVLFAMDREGVITLAEGKGLEGLGVKPGEHVGQSIFDVYRDMPEVLENVRRALAGEAVAPVIRVGNLLFESWYSPIRDESGEVAGVISVATDITERRRAEEALRESEEKYRLVSENIPVAVYSALPDEYSTSLFLSGKMEELTGYPSEQFLQDPQLWTAIVHPDDRAYVWEEIGEHRKHKSPLNLEYRIVTKDGAIKWIRDRATPMVDDDGEILRINGFMEDITERKHLEDQMRQQERLAAVGQLAGGIAHDFNNFLTTIMLYAQILLRKPNLPQELAPVVRTVLEESRRAAQLVRRVLDFSRRSILETQLVNLAAFIAETVSILQRTLPENIRLLTLIDADRCTANVDPARIQQVVMNLALNARDAMPDGGELRISLSCVEVRPEGEPPAADMACGEWVCLTISDTGTGMTDEVHSHMFEPFFTTKGPKGTGLGLSQVYGIVKQHGGHIKVETQVGQGTTFRVYLPAHEAAESGESRQVALASPQGKGEIILLVEDEDRVREAGQEILESLGYQVLTAADGQGALQVYQSAEKVALVLTDMIMPGMGGKELAQELIKIDPRVRVLAITGYTLAEDMEGLRRAGILDVIHKPFEVDTLAEVIRCALDME